MTTVNPHQDTDEFGDRAGSGTPFGPEDPIDAEFDPLDTPELEATSRERSQEEIDELAHQKTREVYAEYQRIILPVGATAKDALIHLNKDIPHNEYGLPTVFYRVDLLPFDVSRLTQAEADAALVALNYDEGYPTYNGGYIFWQQLPGEPLNAFIMYQRYQDMADTTGIRTIHMLSSENAVPMTQVQEWSQIYYWRERARAYDLFRVAADRKLRESRGRRLEDEHYTKAQEMFNDLKNMVQVDEESLANMNLKDRLECMRLLINIMRVSAGLPQNGNAGAVPFNPDAARGPKELLEDITKSVQRDDSGLGLGGGLAELLKDRDFALAAQGVVLRVRHHNDPNAHLLPGQGDAAGDIE